MPIFEITDDADHVFVRDNVNNVNRNTNFADNVSKEAEQMFRDMAIKAGVNNNKVNKADEELADVIKGILLDSIAVDRFKSIKVIRRGMANYVIDDDKVLDSVVNNIIEAIKK